MNNAGLYQDRAGATWDMFVEVNVLGIVRSSNAVVPHLWQQRSGSIINIGSVAAMLAPTSVMGETVDANGPPPRIDPGGYAMTKWMVIYLTRLMARQLGPRNIRVNTVVPGVTMSVATADAIRAAPAILEKRINDSALRSVVQPEDMTGVVTFLASEDSAKMTGQVLVNDAGMWFSG